MTSWNKERYDPIVRNLRNKGRLPKAIWVFMCDLGYPVSLRDVRLALRRLGLETPPIRTTSYDAPAVSLCRLNPIEEAHHILRGRLTERNGAYCLDGRPANLLTIMREVNRIRVAIGMQQISGPASWNCESV